ncbi:hypothetical protein SAMN05428988_5019 [Chitinophaga sp. YR573]|uniref:hypothetical protein n=1 Tax=Chitinophaga sp. YR573 TaxID=1881040 RepID=UPI0008C35291|nr:hypothetical protein [Chitinophaga sp. YR573]SEW39194.1 hypothetical protein SAMN05428988_5019 [Chitinophaga sp. YR573]
MNKVKILLSVIIILGVIGGVFAFKATKRTTRFCTIAMVNGTCTPVRFCITSVLAKTTIGTPNVCYTTVTNVDCNQTLCPTPVKTMPQSPE